MLKTIIVLPDGTELSSGGDAINAIQSVTLTECVNSGEELTLGSTCANALEATLFTPQGGLAIAAGTEVTVYKVDPTGSKKPVGIFILEKPARPSANTMKLTGYDRISKLDKDLTAWLSGLEGWPYQLTTFADMVCEACGLTFVQNGTPNEDFQVQKFTRSSVTGRQIMKWLGEICCSFCRATTGGDIEFAWYTDSGKTISASGDPYYFQNGLTYEDFSTAPIDAVQIRLADSEDGALWPEADAGANSYIITGNPILNATISDGLEEVLNAIKEELAGVSYTPCKVEIPANMDIRAGNTVKITDKNGKTVTAYVMTKTQTGQKDTLECTGSPRRDSATAMNNKTSTEIVRDAVNAQTQEDIFNKLTKNGKIKGIYMVDGELYVNLSYLKSGVIEAEGEVVLPPTLDDIDTMVKSYFDPVNYPFKEFYDLNGNGRLESGDLVIAQAIYEGRKKASDFAVLNPSKVTIRIDPSDPVSTISISGKNMWGSDVDVSLGAVSSKIPFIDGNCNVAGILSVGEYAIIPKLKINDEDSPKNLSWKDNGDGTYTLIGEVR